MMLHNLPHEIITDILSRLPSEYAIHCIEVCKTWRNILHPIKRDKNINLLFVGKYENGFQGTKLYYGELDGKSNKKLNEQLSYNALTPLGCPHVHYSNRVIVGSCRGLVCFLMNFKKLGAQQLSYKDTIYVCNPFTKETVRVPQLTSMETAAKNEFLLIGFGYLNTTKVYKIVRIFYYEDSKFCKGQVQVYTLGDKKGWRNKGITDHFLSKSNGILCNGALHWIANMGTEIVAFDLADERFHSIPIPPCFPKLDSRVSPQLLTLGGCLSIVLHTYSGGYTNTDIWSLKPLMDTKKERGDPVQLHWSNEFTIQSKEHYNIHYCPIALTEENKVLLWQMQRRILKLYHHDSRTATSEEFVYDDNKRFQIFQGIPYMKSSVSLRVLVPDLPAVNWDSMN